MENNMQPVNDNNLNPTNNENVAPQVNSAPPVENVQQPYNQPQQNVQQPYSQPQQNVQQPYSQPQQNVQQPYGQPQQPFNNVQNVFNNVQAPNNMLVPVNKLVYVLLAFFLGGFGIHKFYAGKTTQGVLYLVFCWTFIPSLIAVVDFIIGLTKPADVNGNILI